MPTSFLFFCAAYRDTPNSLWLDWNCHYGFHLPSTLHSFFLLRPSWTSKLTFKPLILLFLLRAHSCYSGPSLLFLNSSPRSAHKRYQVEDVQQIELVDFSAVVGGNSKFQATGALVRAPRSSQHI
eukprot:8582128-Heterocapsa_arctica.AAC.1